MKTRKEKPVTFQSAGLPAARLAGLRLSGVLGVPLEPEPKCRSVVLVHGWGGYRIGPHRILVHAARRLNAEGYATLRLDLRGRGDSDGNGQTVCLDEMIEDTVAATDFLKAETQAKSLALLGICSGANVAIGAATLRPDIEALVLWSTLPFQPEQQTSQRVRRARHYVADYMRKACSPATWLKLIRGDVNTRMVGKTVKGEKKPASGERNLKDSRRDIMAAFASYRGRALFVTGTNDPEGMAGYRLFQKVCKAQGLDASFQLVTGATHSFYAPSHEKQVIEATISWLKTRKI